MEILNNQENVLDYVFFKKVNTVVVKEYKKNARKEQRSEALDCNVTFSVYFSLFSRSWSLSYPSVFIFSFF